MFSEWPTRHMFKDSFPEGLRLILTCSLHLPEQTKEGYKPFEKWNLHRVSSKIQNRSFGFNLPAGGGGGWKTLPFYCVLESMFVTKSNKGQVDLEVSCWVILSDVWIIQKGKEWCCGCWSRVQIYKQKKKKKKMNRRTWQAKILNLRKISDFKILWCPGEKTTWASGSPSFEAKSGNSSETGMGCGGGGCLTQRCLSMGLTQRGWLTVCRRMKKKGKPCLNFGALPLTVRLLLWRPLSPRISCCFLILTSQL